MSKRSFIILFSAVAVALATILLIVKPALNKKQTAIQPFSIDLVLQLHDIIDSLPAEAGIAIMADGATLEINGIQEFPQEFPLLSVMKFPQAMAVCAKLDENGMSLDDKVNVSPKELCHDTWSPMLECYPEGGEITIGTLLDYALVQSDNNACDLLFSHVADMDYTRQYIAQFLPEGFHLSATEQMMHQNPARCYDNSCTPLAAAQLMEHWQQHHEGANASRVWEMMARCQTGENRIPRYIANQVSGIVHKTGTGPAIAGKIVAVNDVACLLMPDGRHLTLAVFIKDAQCSLEECEEAIARIAETVVKNATQNN